MSDDDYEAKWKPLWDDYEAKAEALWGASDREGAAR